MPVERIQPQGLPKPPTYAHVVKAGPSTGPSRASGHSSGQATVYIAGQVAQDEQGQVVGRGDFTAQAIQVFENLKKALSSAGADFKDLVKINVYLTDARYREPLSEVRARYLQGPLPASTLVVVAGLAQPDYLLEIEGIAVLG